MKYVNLGDAGLRVSRICLGMMSYGKHESREWALEEKAAEPIVRRAVEGGITFFDTADENGRGLSRKHIMASIDASLKRLELDYVDLYQIHRWDPLTRIAETMDALHDVVKAGRPATSARAACTHGSSPRPNRSRAPASCRCRITTTSCTARRSAR